MAIGDVFEVDGARDLYCLDTGIYDTPEYGSVYVLDAERPAIVDTGIGTNYERVLATLEEIGIASDELAVIAPTHVHLDHAGGTGFLAAECPNAEVVVHEIGAPHLVDPGRLVEGTKRAVGDQWEFYAEPKPVPEDRIRELTDGDVIDLGDRTLEAHHAPGHAPHQVVFFAPEDAVAFTADAAGIYVPAVDRVEPTTPPPNFDLEASLDDVDALRDLGPETLCYGHFGPAPTADRLDRYETTLREWVVAVENERERLGDDDAVVEHFFEEDDLDEVWGERRARGHVDLNVRGVLLYLDRREE